MQQKTIDLLKAIKEASLEGVWEAIEIEGKTSMVLVGEKDYLGLCAFGGCVIATSIGMIATKTKIDGNSTVFFLDEFQGKPSICEHCSGETFSYVGETLLKGYNYDYEQRFEYKLKCICCGSVKP